MPRFVGAALQVRYYFVCGSRSAKDVAKNASRSAARVAVSVASVTVAGVLPVAIVIAPHKAVTKGLRRGAAEVVRSLWVEALPALRVTCTGTQAGLVSLVHRHLGPVVIAAIVPVVTIAPVITVDAAVIIDPDATIVAVIAIITVIIDLALIPVASPIAVSILIISPIATTALVLRIAIISIASTLGLCCRAGHDEYTENKRKA